jgi:hypothetical protein
MNLTTIEIQKWKSGSSFRGIDNNPTPSLKTHNHNMTAIGACNWRKYMQTMAGLIKL